MASEWTLTTLKELLENRLKALEDQCKSDKMLLSSNAEHVAEELKKQASEYERRLSALNGEAARISSANAANVSREVYDAFITSNDEWKRRIEALVNNAVPQSEYRAYKESTSTALTLQTGKREERSSSMTMVLAVIGAVGTIIGAVLAVMLIFGSNHGPATPSVIYLQAPPLQSPTTTTTTKP